MPRKRYISPEFFTHGELYQAEIAEGLPLRLAYAGLWCVADRRGRFVWKPLQLKLDVLPFDTVDFAVVLEALRRHGYIRCYRVAGRLYGDIPTFLAHQHPHPRETDSRLPAYHAECEVLAHASVTHARSKDEGSSKPEAVMAHTSSIQEAKGSAQPGGVSGPSGSQAFGNSGPSGSQDLRDLKPSEFSRAPNDARESEGPGVRRRGRRPKSPVEPPGENWVARCVDLWRAHAGEPNAGQLGRALKPVHDAIGLADLLRALEHWLKSGDGKYGPDSFARSYRKILDDLEPIPVYDPDTGEPTAAFLAATRGGR